jgi:hypothetical protein
MTYEIYDRPAQVQADDLEIVNGALAIARALRDDVVTVGSSPFNCRAFVDGIAATIRVASRRINDPDAERAVWRFGAYVGEASGRDEIDDLICDYLSDAQQIVEQGYGQ